MAVSINHSVELVDLEEPSVGALLGAELEVLVEPVPAEGVEESVVDVVQNVSLLLPVKILTKS